MNRSSARCSRARPRPSSSSSNPSLRQKIEREDEGRGTRTNSLGRFMAPMRVQSWRLKLSTNLALSPLAVSATLRTHSVCKTGHTPRHSHGDAFMR